MCIVYRCTSSVPPYDRTGGQLWPSLSVGVEGAILGLRQVPSDGDRIGTTDSCGSGCDRTCGSGVMAV